MDIMVFAGWNFLKNLMRLLQLKLSYLYVTRIISSILYWQASTCTQILAIFNIRANFPLSAAIELANPLSTVWRYCNSCQQEHHWRRWEFLFEFFNYIHCPSMFYLLLWNILNRAVEPPDKWRYIIILCIYPFPN